MRQIYDGINRLLQFLTYFNGPVNSNLPFYEISQGAPCFLFPFYGLE